jgi:ubiquinol-cytochrome c reductase cytochrome c1 subunit
MTMIIRKTLAAAALVAALPAAGFAAGAGGEVTDVDFSFEGPLGTYDEAQLQRGLQVYNEVCAACHGLKYVAFRTLGSETGPNYGPEQVRAFAEMYQVADESADALPGDLRPAKPSDNFPPNEALGAPDLSLMAKARAGFHGPYGTGISQLVNGMGGPEYIYSLLTGYTGNDKFEAGTVLYENPVMSGGWIAMAPPLTEGIVEYADGTPATESQMARDVSAFLMWTAEPKLTERKHAGARNIVYLGVLAVLLYLTNKQLWKAVKSRRAA